MERKKKFLNVIIALILIIPALFFCGCEDDEHHYGGSSSHNNASWFTEAELSKVGLTGLTAPQALSGDMHTSTSWFNDGYSFYQPCEDKTALALNAQNYLNYFQKNYYKQFGTASVWKSSSTAFYYRIIQKNSIRDYFEDNPSDLYKFYYVTNTQSDESGNFVSGSVYTLEIRYEKNSDSEPYMLKLFIEKADVSHNAQIKYYYSMA